MKQFKKRRTKLPRTTAVLRLMRRYGGDLQYRRYRRFFSTTDSTLPEIIREVTLAKPDPRKRGNICYFPDMRNFMINDEQNRSLPAQKFLDIFKGMVDQAVLDQLLHDLTNYRLEIYTEAQEWVDVYEDDNVHSCMSQSHVVRCYAHPENNLAIAALYAPGTNMVVARTIVNTEEKWYVRLFGDALLVTKLNELGYSKLNRIPPEFKMYAWVGTGITNYHPDHYDAQFPYFDFRTSDTRILRETYNRDTGFVECIINEGVT
jgi:hypothetical protein